MRHVGMNMEQVKLQNRSSILNYINNNGPVSRKDIADATGLTPAAVTQICNVFLEEGLLLELGVDQESTGAGRKKILVNLNYEYEYIYGINIEPEKTYICLSNLKGEFLEQMEMDTDRSISPERFLKQVGEACKELGKKQPKKIQDKIASASVGITGIVDREKGISVHAYGIWNEEVPVCEILQKELKLYVCIENNVNAFAIATMLYGVGRYYDNLHIIKWGPGVGSTLIIDGKVYEGRHGKAAELGHFIVEKDGTQCSCGRKGCLETKVSYCALQKIVEFEHDSFGEAYQNATEDEKAQFEEAIDLFARSIVNSATIIAPNRVVLSGYLFRDEIIRKRLIGDCMSYDKRFDENRILYNSLSQVENCIGPIAAYVQSEIF